jgi:hypothetical protein
MLYEPETLLSQTKDVASIIGVIVAILTLVKGVSEYVLQGAQKRFEQFLAIRKKLDEEDSFTRIINALDDTPDELNDINIITIGEKRYFLSYFEEIALMVNSDLMPLEVAHYMFGYYAIACWESKQFWANMEDEKSDDYWALFRAFAKQMKKQREAQNNSIAALNKLQDKDKLHRFLQQKIRFDSFWTKLKDWAPKDDS